MKNIALAFFVIILLFSCNQDCTKTIGGCYEKGVFDLEVKDYYPNCNDTTNYIHKAYFENDSLAHKIVIKNNEFNGEYISYNQNGQLEKQGNYINGKRNGTWEFWFGDSVYQEKHYLKDTLQGSFYEKKNNEYISFGSFKNGKEEGKWSWLYPDSTIDYEAEYKGGKLNGIVRDYHRNGQLVAVILFSNDTIENIQYAYDSLGSETLKSGEGNWIVYGKNGSMLRIEEYSKGNKVE